MNLRVVVIISASFFFLLIMLFFVSQQQGGLPLTGNFMSDSSIDSIRSNTIVLFAVLGLISVLCVFIKMFFGKYDSQN